MEKLYFDVTIEKTGDQEWTVKVRSDDPWYSFTQKVGSDPDAADVVRRCAADLLDEACVVHGLAD